MTDTVRAERRSRWIPLALFGSFALLLAADGVFVYLAVSSNPGVAVPNAYERGLAHNEVLRAAAAQEALGWTGTVTVMPDGDAVELRLTDRDGAPIWGAALRGRLARVVEDRDDRQLDFVARGDGRYLAPLADAGPGLWELAVTAARGSDRYQIVRRITIR